MRPVGSNGHSGHDGVGERVFGDLQASIIMRDRADGP